jgi:hypothetical protein
LEAHAEALIEAQDKAGIYGLAVVGGSMAFVRYALPDWTKAKLLPLLDSNQYPNQARVLWPAWLQYGRLSAELIEELPPFLASQHQILLKSETDISNRYLSYAAIVITNPFSKVSSLDWIKNILVSASPLQRGWWTKEIARCMLDQQEAHQVVSWRKWAQDYWQARLVGLWGPISAEEFSGFLRWPIAFGANFEEAFVLLRKLEPQPKKRLGLLHDLGKTTLPEKKPDAVPAYLKWVFDNVSLEPYGAYEIEEIAPRLQVTASNVRDIEALGNRLIELGYSTAGDLLLAKAGQWRSSHPA